MMIDVTCDKSPDGRHELRWVSMTGAFTCRHCNTDMEWYIHDGEGDKPWLRLINASLRLTAEEAQEAIDNLPLDKAIRLILYRDSWRGEANEHS